MKHFISVLIVAGVAFGLTSCDQTPAQTETERFNIFLDERYDLWVSRSPEWQSYLGIKDDNDKWDNYSPEHIAESLELARTTITDIEAFDYDTLDHQAQLSFQLYKAEMERIITW
ncbi:MAG: DUF885 family protein, partial [Rhodospirillaceae bacterium]|nr:DUF885 family protein [Rhodospirillaceae bacterium]